VQIEQLADLVAERLAPLLAGRLNNHPVPQDGTSDVHREQSVPQNGGGLAALVDVHEIARITHMSERWVYDHATAIGGVKAGQTKRARWRFDPARALALLAERNGELATERGPQPERRELSGDAPLLPVRGKAA
jgi:hypothetical protein